MKVFIIIKKGKAFYAIISNNLEKQYQENQLELNAKDTHFKTLTRRV